MLANTYDQLEQRIKELMQQEELNKIRPDLTGEQIMQILSIKPSPMVGKAYDFLLELRLENGPLGEEKAKQALLTWWKEQS
jgi:poly(A) polymerase